MLTIVAIVGRTFVLLGLGAAAGFAWNAVRPGGVNLSAQVPAAAAGMCAQPAATAAGGAAADPSAVSPAIEILAPAHASGLCGDPRTLVADARPAAAFAAGHVAGAIHLPCAATRGAASAALDLLEGKQALIVYGASTEEAIPVAEELRRRSGSRDLRVLVLAGGFSAWTEEGLACSSGPCPDCGDRERH